MVMFSFFENDLLSLLSEFYFLLVIVFVLCFSSFISSLRYYRYVSLMNSVFTLSCLSLILFYFLKVNNLFLLGNICYGFCNLGIREELVLYILLIFFFVILFISRVYLKFRKIVDFEYYILIFLAFLGMIGMVLSNDLLLLYISLEIQGLCFYVLTSFNRGLLSSVEAGIKYFIVGSLSSGILLYGMSLIYGFYGSLNFVELFRFGLMDNSSYSLFSLVSYSFVITGFLFKLYVVPFHM